MSDDLLLSLLWAVPMGGGLAILAVPGKFAKAIKVGALVVSAITLGLAIFAFAAYVGPGDSGKSPASESLADRAARNTLKPRAIDSAIFDVRDQPGDLVVRNEWVGTFRIEYYLGLDGIGLAMVLLTGLVGFLACLASWEISEKVKGYFSLYLILLSTLMGVFLALDLFLFFVFFELMLLPMYFLIAVWGGPRREYAAIKFLLYTLFGSVFILVAILLLYFWAEPGKSALRSFDAVLLATRTWQFGPGIQAWIFGLLFLGFCIKLPSVPFHTWLPDAHVEAPTPISMILAGVLLKVGGYGLVRLAWPLAPVGALAWAYPVAALGTLSILYGAFAAMAQADFKKLVAYSSVSHMGYVTLGLAAMTLSGDPRPYDFGVNGAIFMMIAHGVTSTAMFFLVGVIYDRAHTRDLRSLGGLIGPMPGYAFASFLIFFGSMGLPGLCGFIGEVLVILSAFSFDLALAILAASAVVLTAGYILWALQRVFLGPNPRGLAFPDLSAREWTVLAPLLVLTVALGVAPQALVFRWVSPSAARMVDGIARAQNPPPEPPPPPVRRGSRR